MQVGIDFFARLKNCAKDTAGAIKKAATEAIESGITRRHGDYEYDISFESTAAGVDIFIYVYGVDMEVDIASIKQSLAEILRPAVALETAVCKQFEDEDSDEHEAVVGQWVETPLFQTVESVDLEEFAEFAKDHLKHFQAIPTEFEASSGVVLGPLDCWCLAEKLGLTENLLREGIIK